MMAWFWVAMPIALWAGAHAEVHDLRGMDGGRNGVHHEMKVRLIPTDHRIEVEETVTLPGGGPSSGQKIRFLLHAGLTPRSPTAGVKVVREEKPDLKRFGIDSEIFDPGIPVEGYTLFLPPGTTRLILEYRGEIHHPFQEGEDVRGGGETPGTLSTNGVYLAGSTLWYPRFSPDPVTFSIDVTAPAGWEVVSQGARTAHRKEETGGETGMEVRWESPEPQEEIFLVGGPLTEYRREREARQEDGEGAAREEEVRIDRAGEGEVREGEVIDAVAFLRTPDPELARSYLDVTGPYIEMYQRLIGPYPYKKFALVENFWETGYGMPSFTLLGSEVIRLPFILHSSYPHEILHNWWGNGVYVDFKTGNWSEGLTAYLADHLLSEQRGTGALARRASLQKYADYVGEGKDFPLTAFRGRHNAVTEAVGYGKTLMFFHMLRREWGDAVFLKALRIFYQENRFKRAAFSDLERAFSRAAGNNLKGVFSQWVGRVGAPELAVSRAKGKPEGEGYLLTAVLEQRQPGPAYTLAVPVAVTLADREEAYQTTVEMTGKRVEFSLPLPARPVYLDVDPEFDLFRRLDPAETPPALSRTFGATKALILLPAAAPGPMREGYRAMVEGWKQGGPQGSPEEIEIKLDNEVETLPADRAVWLFGWENRFRQQILSQLADQDLQVNSATIRIGESQIPRRGHSFVLTTRHPSDPRLSMTWVAADLPAALPGLGRKLPHYGRYGYLGFQGEEPTNVVKGEWSAVHSPLSIPVVQADRTAVKGKRGKWAPRTPLATLPPPATP